MRFGQADWCRRDGMDWHLLRTQMVHNELTVPQSYLASAGEGVRRAHTGPWLGQVFDLEHDKPATEDGSS